jgi:hypothetical protein
LGEGAWGHNSTNFSQAAERFPVEVIGGMWPKRNVGLVAFGFTRASADRIAARLIDTDEVVVYAAWYWCLEPIDGDKGPAYKGPTPDGIAVWTSRGVLLIAVRFTWGMYWIAEAHVVRRYPAGEALPVLVTAGGTYDSATIHGETFWFGHGCVPSGFA